jgi:uncharacterized protein YjiS (DUF1127 family)
MVIVRAPGARLRNNSACCATSRAPRVSLLSSGRARPNAATQPGIHRRSGPLLRALRDAAPTDPELANLWREMESWRLYGQGRFAGQLAERGHLRDGLSVEEARDIVFTLCSPSVYDILVVERGLDAGWLPRLAGVHVYRLAARLPAGLGRPTHLTQRQERFPRHFEAIVAPAFARDIRAADANRRDRNTRPRGPRPRAASYLAGGPRGRRDSRSARRALGSTGPGRLAVPSPNATRYSTTINCSPS